MATAHPTSSPRSKILVDGNCIVCDWEVGKYKHAAPDAFEIVDISSPEFDASAYGLTTAAVNRRMHVLAPDDRVQTGVAAFAHIWSRIPSLRWAARAVTLPVVAQLATVGYELFALFRPWLPKKSRR